jgi:hypothetical protein
MWLTASPASLKRAAAHTAVLGAYQCIRPLLVRRVHGFRLGLPSAWVRRLRQMVTPTPSRDTLATGSRKMLSRRWAKAARTMARCRLHCATPEQRVSLDPDPQAAQANAALESGAPVVRHTHAFAAGRLSPSPRRPAEADACADCRSGASVRRRASRARQARSGACGVPLLSLMPFMSPSFLAGRCWPRLSICRPTAKAGSTRPTICPRTAGGSARRPRNTRRTRRAGTRTGSAATQHTRSGRR